MKDYKKSDYALNKNRKGIVYRNADGSTLEITFEKIAEGKPQFTYEDFQKLKQFSDSIYLEQVKADGRYSYYVKGSYDEIPDSTWLATKVWRRNCSATPRICHHWRKCGGLPARF